MQFWHQTFTRKANLIVAHFYPCMLVPIYPNRVLLKQPVMTKVLTYNRKM